MGRRPARELGLGALLLPLLPFLVAGTCSNPAPPRSPADEADALVVGTTAPLGARDPADCYDAFCAYTLFANTHEGLTRIDPETLEVAGALATSWEVSGDGETYRLALQDDAAFHDGAPFDAAAMEASLERVRELGRGGARFLLFGQDGVERVEATSEHTLEVELSAPDAAFPAKLAFPVAAAVPPDTELHPDDPPAGTGPYSIVRWEGDAVDLSGDPSHRDGPVDGTAVRLRRFRSAASLQDAVGRGDVHLAVRRWDPAELDELRGDERVRLHERPGVAIRFLAFTTAHEPYDDPRLRRSVAAAVDRAGLIEGPLRGAADPLYSLVPPAFGASTPALSSIDDPGAPADGTELDLWYTPSHYGEAEEDAARAIAASLEDAGFEVSTDALAWADLKATLAGGRRPGIFLLGRFPDVLDPADHLVPLLGSRGAAALGTGYASEETDELLAEQERTTDPGARRELLVRIQELAADDLPYVPLWAPDRVVAAGSDVRGLDGARAPHLLLRGVRAGGG